MENEARLIAQAKAGDALAFELLVTPYLPMLFAYSRAICGDYHAAQDVVQETGLIAWRNLEHLFPEADFSTWMRAIARRQALESRRKLKRFSTLADETIEKVYQDPAPASVTTEKRLLTDCLRALDDRTGGIVTDHYFKGSPLAEIAARLGVSLPAVKQQLYRARKSLEGCVKKRLSLEQST